MHGDVEKSKAPKSNNNRIQRGNFYSSMTNGGQGIVSPVLSSLDPVDANYKGCILFVSIDRDDFKSELLSKENFHSTPSPLMIFPFRPMAKSHLPWHLNAHSSIHIIRNNNKVHGPSLGH